MAAVRDPATDTAPPPAIQGEARSSLPADPSRATAALYRRHGATVYRYAWHMLGSREDAEDATQATFLSVHTALTGSTPVREPQAWVLKIARNECLARISARMRRPLTASLDDDAVAEVSAPDPSVPQTVELRSDLQAVNHALGGLPTSQREAYVLREWLGLSTAEVAISLGTSVSAVDALLNRARRELIRVLGGADAAGAAGCSRTSEALADGVMDRATRAHLVRCRSCRAVRRALRPQLVVARSLIPSAALAGRLGDALPGFTASSGGGAIAGSAAASGGGIAAVVAKFAAGPAAMKGAAAALATVAAVGGGVALESATVAGNPQARAADVPAVIVAASAPQKARDDGRAVAATKPVGDDMRGPAVAVSQVRVTGAASGSASGARSGFDSGRATDGSGAAGSGKEQSGHDGSGSDSGSSGSGSGRSGGGKATDHHGKHSGKSGRHKSGSGHDGTSGKTSATDAESRDDSDESTSESRDSGKDSSDSDSSGKGDDGDDRDDSRVAPASP
jgi:RNA polymerase sigma factor (sigma-70 family)